MEFTWSWAVQNILYYLIFFLQYFRYYIWWERYDISIYQYIEKVFENLSQLKSVKIADKISGSEWS